MTIPKYKIGDIIQATQAFGDVMIKDIFRSVSNPDLYCYCVEDIIPGDETHFHSSYLCSEEDLVTF